MVFYKNICLHTLINTPCCNNIIFTGSVKLIINFPLNYYLVKLINGKYWVYKLTQGALVVVMDSVYPTGSE